MNLIQSVLLQHLPTKRKTTPSGWSSFNAVCCHNNGHSQDKRKRGGIIVLPNGGFTYHCFNCHFKAGWQPGSPLGSNCKKLFSWLGVSEVDIGKLNLFSIKEKDLHTDKSILIPDLNLKEIDLPDDARLIEEWIQLGADDPDLINTIEYLTNRRKMQWDWYPWYWSPAPGFRDRVILPFFHEQKIVGYTARRVTDQRPKYLTQSQPGYVFNLDRQNHARRFVIVVEGQFDAIAIDGVAIMTNEPSDTQIFRINQLDREVICVPDRDRAGSKMLTAAIKHNWSVSLPPWQDHIKDVNDAVSSYGRLYTLNTILHYRVQGEIRIQLIKKQLETRHDQI